MNTNRQDYDREYNQSFRGRLRTAKQYHFSQVARSEPTALDTLTDTQLEAIWNNQQGICLCCGLEIESFQKANISHISTEFFFTAMNFQMLHFGCNKAQADLTMPFLFIWKTYGECFLDLFINCKDWTIETFNLDASAVKRFDNRVKKIREGKVNDGK